MNFTTMFSFTILNIYQLSKSFLNIFKLNVAILCAKLDPISNVGFNPSSKTVKYHLLFPIFIIVFQNLFGTIVLELDSTGVFSLDLSNSPYIFSHQITPKSIWKIIDILIFVDTITGIIFIVLLFNSNLSECFKMKTDGRTVYIGSKRLNVGISTKMLRVRKMITNTFYFLFFCLNIVSYLNFYYWVIFVNKVYAISFVSGFNFIFIFPLHMIFIMYANFSFNLYIILACNYIKIMQKHEFDKLGHLKQQNNKKSNLKWNRIIQINYNFLNLAKITKVYARLSARQLSLSILNLIFLQCYLAYVFIFINISLFEKTFFILSVFELNIFLFMIIHQCSLVEKFNRKFEMANRQICFEFLHQKNLLNDLNIGQLGKITTLYTAKRFQPYTFKIFSNFRITTNSYIMVNFENCYSEVILGYR